MRWYRVQSDEGDFTADDFVLCLGVRSPDLLRQIGIDLPIYPARGYSLTVPITDRQAAPRMGGLDSENMVAYCPMGDRLRLTTVGVVRGFNQPRTPQQILSLYWTRHAVCLDIAPIFPIQNIGLACAR